MYAKFIDEKNVEYFDEERPQIEFINEGRVSQMVNPTSQHITTIPSYTKKTGDYRVYKEFVKMDNVNYDLDTQRIEVTYTETNDKIFEVYNIIDK